MTNKSKTTSTKPSTRRAKSRKPTPKRLATAKPSNATRLDHIIAALRTAKGASVPDLMKLTGWQTHSVRGAMSGALKKDRRLTISSEKQNGERIYRIKA